VLERRSINVGEHPKFTQEHYLEETFKMRNLLEEFDDTKNYGLRKPTILGVREHVFTGRCTLIFPSFIDVLEEVMHVF